VSYGRLTLAASKRFVLRGEIYTGIRLVWNLPLLIHCYSLPLICRCLPVFHEICRRSLNFVRACVQHESPLVRSLALYGLTVARNDSFFDKTDRNIDRNIFISAAYLQ